MFVKPGQHPEKPGEQLVVRHPGPSFALLPKDGAEVPDNQFWRRRVLHGDVVIVEPQAPKAVASASPPIAAP